MVQPIRRRFGRKFNAIQCLKCAVKTGTFLFWASLYMIVMKLTIFKSSAKQTPVEDWSDIPDNYSKWMIKGPPIDGEELYNEIEQTMIPENVTILDLEERANRVHRVCREKGISKQRVNNKEFFVDHVHNIVWCNIFKAASSAWLYNFNILGGYKKKYLERTHNSPLTLARKKFRRPSEEELKDAVNTPGVLSLIIVREPFARLLSAYRDKLENTGPRYYWKLARKIVAEHRVLPNPSFGPTFAEFVAYLIKKYKNGNHRKYDEHWAPYYQFCSPCAINFSVIAKVETLNRDSAYVINELSLGEFLGKGVRSRRTQLRTVMNKSRDGRNTTTLLKFYFKQLNRKMLDDLLKIYGTDFEMFGYNASIYRDYVTN